MAMLDMLQLPDGSYGLPAAGVDPFTGLSAAEVAAQARDAAAERMRRGIRRPASIPIDYGAWDPGATPYVGPDMIPSTMLNAPMPSPALSPVAPAAAADAPAPPASAPAPPPPAEPSWLGMLNVVNPGGPPPPMPTPAPAQATPAQAAIAPIAAAASNSDAAPETSLLGRLGNAFNKIGDTINNRSGTLLALGAGLAGAQNIGQGLSRGFAAALPAMQQDIKLQQQNQTVAALMKRGIPQDVALSAASNPAIMQQIIGQVFGPKALQHVTLKDRLGNEIPMAFDPTTGKYISANVGGAGGASLSAGDPTKTGDDYLKSLDPLTQNEVKAFAEGRAPVTARNLQTMLPMVTQYDPTFDAAQYPVRLATRKSYTSGKQFQELQAINTVAGHLDDLSKASDDLKNTRFPWWNTIANTTLQATGDARVDNFNTVKQAVTNELSKAYRGGHVTEGDVREWQENISAAKSPEQLRGVIGKMNDLLESKRRALEDGYRSSMGPAPLPENFRAASEHAAETFGRVADWAHGVKTERGKEAPATSSAGQAVTSGKLSPGTSYTWTPQGLIPNQASPPVPGARQAPDGHWYIGEPGNYLRIIH